jgi:hypothetical protein
MTTTTEPLTPPARAILAALEAGPMTRQALSEAIGQPLGSVGTRLVTLAARGLVQIGGDMVALPGQPIGPWRPDRERIHEERRQQWQEAGLITLHPDDLGGFAAQALWAYGIARYGRRGARQAR